VRTSEPAVRTLAASMIKVCDSIQCGAALTAMRSMMGIAPALPILRPRRSRTHSGLERPGRHGPGVVVVVVVVIVVGLFDYDHDHDHDHDNDNDNEPGISVTTSVLIAPGPHSPEA